MSCPTLYSMPENIAERLNSFLYQSQILSELLRWKANNLVQISTWQ